MVKMHIYRAHTNSICVSLEFSLQKSIEFHSATEALEWSSGEANNAIENHKIDERPWRIYNVGWGMDQ